MQRALSQHLCERDLLQRVEFWRPAAAGAEEECAVCYEELNGQVVPVLPCGHQFCYHCIAKHSQTSEDCPLCRGPIPFATPRILMHAQQGSVRDVRADLQHWAPVDARSAKLSTPLIAAVMHNHFEVAVTLLAAGADVNAATAGGITALWCAGHQGHEELARLLLTRGASEHVSVGGMSAKSFPVVAALF